LVSPVYCLEEGDILILGRLNLVPFSADRLILPKSPVAQNSFSKGLPERELELHFKAVIKNGGAMSSLFGPLQPFSGG